MEATQSIPVVRQGIIETLKPLLFEVSRADPETLAAVIIFLFLAGAAIGATVSMS